MAALKEVMRRSQACWPGTDNGNALGEWRRRPACGMGG
jgi:hypothetical protein